MRVAALIMGDRHPAHWSEGKPPAFDEWDAKWLAEVMARAAHPGAEVELRPGAGDVLWEIAVDGRSIGAARRVALDAPVWAAPAFGVELLMSELSAEPVAAPGARAESAAARGDGRRAIAYRPLPTTPASGFDIALLVPNDMPVARVEEQIRKVSGALLERLTLSSEFRGGSVPEGFRSVAWQLTLRHPERTLESREIAGRRERLLKVLEGELGVRIR
jgi:phenylalanyl-tRNA synthetase beta chain